jgi:hypothetical protein
MGGAFRKPLSGQELLRIYYKGWAPVEGYLYSFQLAILSVLVFLCVTFLVLAGGFGGSTGSYDLDQVVNRFWIVLSGSIALRECWAR